MSFLLNLVGLGSKSKPPKTRTIKIQGKLISWAGPQFQPKTLLMFGYAELTPVEAEQWKYLLSCAEDSENVVELDEEEEEERESSEYVFEVTESMKFATCTGEDLPDKIPAFCWRGEAGDYIFIPNKMSTSAYDSFADHVCSSIFEDKLHMSVESAKDADLDEFCGERTFPFDFETLTYKPVVDSKAAEAALSPSKPKAEPVSASTPVSKPISSPAAVVSPVKPVVEARPPSPPRTPVVAVKPEPVSPVQQPVAAAPVEPTPVQAPVQSQVAEGAPIDFEIDEVVASKPCALWQLDYADGQYHQVVDNVFAVIALCAKVIDGERYTTYMLLVQNQPATSFVTTRIEPGMCPEFYEDFQSFAWVHVPAGEAPCVYSAMFKDPADYEDFKDKIKFPLIVSTADEPEKIKQEIVDQVEDLATVLQGVRMDERPDEELIVKRTVAPTPVPAASSRKSISRVLVDDDYDESERRHREEEEEARQAELEHSPDQQEVGTLIYERRGKFTNRMIVDSSLHNTALVARGPCVDVFRRSDREMEYVASLNNLKTSKGIDLLGNVMLHDRDTKLLMLGDNQENPDLRGRVAVLDIERGQIVEEWETQDSLVKVNSIVPTGKLSHLDSDSVVAAHNASAIFAMDPRLSGRNKMVANPTDVMYAASTRTKFSAAVVNQAGHLATGSVDGKVRFYTRVPFVEGTSKGAPRQAKNEFFTACGSIIGMDMTQDSKWVAITAKQRIMVLSGTNADGTSSAFAKKLGDEKQSPMILTLAPHHTALIGQLNFTPARFDLDENGETWICTSSGNWLIAWNFKKVLSGNPRSYIMKDVGSAVMDQQFMSLPSGYTAENAPLLVATGDSVRLERRAVIKSRPSFLPY